MTHDVPLSLARLSRAWNRFFHAPPDARVCAALRIGIAVVVLIDFAFAAPHLEMYWGERGVLPFEVARDIADDNTWTAFRWLPKTSGVLWLCYLAAIASAALLALGLASRANAALLFLWLVSFQHRNVLLLSGQDVVLRVLCFLIVFLPIGAVWSLDARRRGSNAHEDGSGWALRVIQIQMCLILWSAGMEKLGGSFWWSGDALYYVAHLDDFCCHYPVPELLRSDPWVYRPLSWMALAIELVAPFLLWFKETRRAALIAIISLHLGIEYMMNLGLFEWAMLVGWLAHVRAEDVACLCARFPRAERDAS